MQIEVKKLDPNAVIPTKGRNRDTGWDVTLISMVEEKPFKNCSLTRYIYDTGLVIKPPEGYYCDFVPRSGFSKSGYLVGNSYGVIEADYRGSLKAVLYKIRDSVPDLKLPGRYLQLILRPLINADIVEVEEMDETERGDQGFGSSGK